MFAPRYLKQAKHYLSICKKLYRYRKDILSDTDRTELERQIEALKKAIRARNRSELEQLPHQIDPLLHRLAPPQRNIGWREHCEVLLVAVVIAAGVRAYFLQPFKIPTGSMQPTLNGIIATKTDTPFPNPIKRAFDFVFLGRNYIDVVAKADETIVSMSERNILNFFSFTSIYTQQNKYTVFAPMDALSQYFGVVPGARYRADQIIARGQIDTGDQVFVDKFSYHFVQPKLGDVFVFKTNDIYGIQSRLPAGVDSQHYIKRLAGLPGNELQIIPPNLYINDNIPQVKSLLRVMSSQNGYQGYSNTTSSGTPFQYLGAPYEIFKVPPSSYFALGDNSYNSSDSRNWGVVPERNITGKGFIVYWPFSKRWGLIR